MKLKTIFIIISAIFTLSGCKTANNIYKLRLYPEGKSSVIHYNIRSWRTVNDPPSKTKRQITADWEKSGGILVSFPFDVPINLLQEISKEHKIYIMVGSKKERRLAVEESKKLNININNIQFIKNRKSINNIQNIGLFGVKNDKEYYSLSSQYVNKSHKNKIKTTIFKFNGKNTKTLKTNAIFDAESVLFDGMGTMYADINFINVNEQKNKVEQVRKTLTVDLSLRELIYIPLLNDSITLSSIMRVLDSNRILIKEPAVKNAEYLQCDILSKSQLNDFFSDYDKGKHILRIKESLINGIKTSYISAFIFNTTVFVPLYGAESDKYALEQWQVLMPNHTIIGSKLRAEQRPWSHRDYLFNRIKIIF